MLNSFQTCKKNVSELKYYIEHLPSNIFFRNQQYSRKIVCSSKLKWNKNIFLTSVRLQESMEIENKT